MTSLFHVPVRLGQSLLLCSLAACAAADADPLAGLNGITVVDGMYEGQIPSAPAPDEGAIIFRTGS